MTNKEILQADMLDILFEHRNKLYGAYALRKTYSRRLGRALGIALAIVLAFITISFIKSEKGSNRPDHDAGSIILTDVNLEKEKIKEPERPREEPRPSVAQADHQNIVIAPDEEATNIPNQEQIENSAISNINAEGATPEDPAKAVTQNEDKGDGEEKARKDFDETKVDLLMNELFPGENVEVPDPWYGPEPGFHEVYKLINEACDKIIERYGMRDSGLEESQSSRIS